MQPRSTPRLTLPVTGPPTWVVLIWSLLAIPIAFGGIFGIWGLFKAPSAYGYQNGQDVVAVTEAGRVCESQYGRGGGGTECPATWEIDGEEVTGTLTTRYGGDGEGIAGYAGSHEARAWGSTAATGYDDFDLWWGLNAWWMVLGAVTFIGVPMAVTAWREPRGVRRALDSGARVAFGPVDVADDGLTFGEQLVPWDRVSGIQVRKIGRQKVGVNKYTVPTKQITLRIDDQDVALPAGAISSASLFEQLVRARIPVHPRRPLDDQPAGAT